MKTANGDAVSETDIELLKNVGRVLASLREAAGYSQREAAQEIGASQATVSYLENGKTDSHILTIQKWANLYGYDVELHFTRRTDEFDQALIEAITELAP